MFLEKFSWELGVGAWQRRNGLHTSILHQRKGEKVQAAEIRNISEEI